MVDAEAVILEELERLSPLGGFEQADWADVVRRAQPPLMLRRERELGWLSAHRRAPRYRAGAAPRRRRLYLGVAAALLLIALAAPAFAFRAQIIDFLTAAHAPKNVVVYFGRLKVMESQVPGAAPGVFPARARRVTSIRVGGKTSVLYVAPTKGGGFCAFWTTYDAPQCVSPGQRTGPSRFATIGYSSMYPSLGVDTVEGEVFARDATVKLLYADGATTVIPYVWVTAPINAGFFLYEIPTDRRLGKTRPLALTVVRDGKTLAREPIEDISKTVRVVDHRDRWGQSIQTTPEEVWSKRHLLFSFNTSDGRLIELWVMPSRKGPSRRCVAGTFSFGCEPAVFTGPPVQLQIGGGRSGSVILSGEVAGRVTRVELRYQDGARQTVAPKDRFVLIEIRHAHYQLRHRLVSAVGFDKSGHVVGVKTYDVTTPDIYPCRKPKNYGYGVLRCP